MDFSTSSGCEIEKNIYLLLHVLDLGSYLSRTRSFSNSVKERLATLLSVS